MIRRQAAAGIGGGFASSAYKAFSQTLPPRPLAIPPLDNGRVVQINYPISGDNMLRNMQYWTSFEDMINKIWAEMEQRHAAA